MAAQLEEVVPASDAFDAKNFGPDFGECFFRFTDWRLVAAARAISESCTWAHVRETWVREYHSVRSSMTNRDAALGPAGRHVA